jgi:hypothetical protein
LHAQFKQLLPSTTNVKDSTGWVTDDIILLSLSLSVILKRNLKSIATPLLFQSMLLNCVPRAEASANFVQSFRVLIPTLDSENVKEPKASAQLHLSKQPLSSAPSTKYDSILQHPHVQHKMAISLRSFDVLEWLELAEQQLEAACAFETADIPHLIMFQEQKLSSVMRRRSSKEQWKHQMKSGFRSGARSSSMLEDIELLKTLSKCKNSDMAIQQNEEEKESFDPLELLFQMESQRKKEAAQALAHADKVKYSKLSLAFLKIGAGTCVRSS